MQRILQVQVIQISDKATVPLKGNVALARNFSLSKMTTR